MILPTLVRLLNLEKALILQQIHFHAQAPKSGKDLDGYHWIWNTYKDWTEDFPFWKPRTIQKWILELEQEGYLISKQYDLEGWNARKYYRINHEYLDQKVAEMPSPAIVHDDARPKKKLRQVQRKQIVHVDASLPVHDDALIIAPDRARSIHEQRLHAETTNREQIREESLKPSLTAPAVGDVLPLFSASPQPDNNSATDKPTPPVHDVRVADSFAAGGESGGGILPQVAPGCVFEPDPSANSLTSENVKGRLVSVQRPRALQSPKTPKLPTDPRASHPAIAAVRDLARRFPKDILWDKIIERLGDTPVIAKLKECYLAHVERGYNPNSWIWATEWYGAGIPQNNVKQKKERTYDDGSALWRDIERREGVKFTGPANSGKV